MIEPRYYTLQGLFADRVFRVPHYQRFYSWGTRQRDDLFGDLRKLAKRDDDNHHFMATIVCHRTKEVKEVGASEYRVYDVVDGQQRLTTLILILKCLELTLQPESKAARDLKNVLVKGDENIILLQTNNANEHIFNAFVREGCEPSRAELRTDADRNLSRAIRDCKDFVNDWIQEHGDALSLLRLVQNRLGFVIFDTEDSRIVYSIFEVLNSRGLAVDWLDKCKSVLMGRAFELAKSPTAAEASIGGLQKRWGDVYLEIAKKAIPGEQILRVAATLRFGAWRGKPQPADDALEFFRSDCVAVDRPRKLTDILLDVARKLVSLETNRALEPVTDILHARILAVALMSTECLSESERKVCLEQWERVTFRVFGLCGRDSRTKVGEYVRLAAQVSNHAEGASRYSEIMESLRNLGAEFPIAEAVTAGLVAKNCYDSPPLCRYVLWRYEEHLARLAGKAATLDEDVRREIWRVRAEDTVEHIFPQNPEPGGAWDGKMRRGSGKAQALGEHVGRIGNLLLLPSGLNEEARRKGFQEKKHIYEKHNMRSVHEVTKKDDWTLREIEARESRIVEFARKAWADVGSD
jgi:hypothetical protein